MEEWKRPINELIENFPGAYQFYNGDKFVFLSRKGVFPMNIWTAGKNLMKTHYHLKRLFSNNLKLVRRY